jgi:hypothetical protein
LFSTLIYYFYAEKEQRVVFIRKNIRLLFVLFVPVYFFIAQNSLQNRHTHISANGIIITHSHPVKHNGNEPLNAHEHSDSEIYFYHFVQFDYFSPSPEIQIIAPAIQQQVDFFTINENSPQQFQAAHHLTRGPPLT